MDDFFNSNCLAKIKQLFKLKKSSIIQLSINSVLFFRATYASCDGPLQRLA
jgi:hypothetical protein